VGITPEEKSGTGGKRPSLASIHHKKGELKAKMQGGGEQLWEK